MIEPTTPLPADPPRIPTLTVDRSVEIETTFRLPGATFVGVAFGGSPPMAVPVWIDEPGTYRFTISFEDISK